jgi:ERCC4-related helicase
VYTSRDVETAYNLLARGIAIGLWSHHEHRRIIGIDDRQAWNALSPVARRSASNKALSQTRKRVMEDLAALQFCNHPKEEYLLNKLGQNTKRSFVSARLIDHAVFLTKRIDQHVATREGKVITLTGIGRGIRKGVSRGARKSNLAAFNSGAASVIVGTSAAGLGIDIVADYGCTLDFDGWTNARQKEGRVGRRSFGLFEYLCTTLDEVAKVNHILYKDVLFQEMLNEQRAAITADAGLPPKLCPSSTTRDTKLSTGWLFS